jgi:hypothetical protein
MRTALKHLPEKDPNRAALYVDLGEMLMKQGGRMAEGRLSSAGGRGRTIAVHGPDFWRTGVALSARGAWHLARRDQEHARADLERAWTLLSARPADDPTPQDDPRPARGAFTGGGRCVASENKYRSLRNQPAPAPAPAPTPTS